MFTSKGYFLCNAYTAVTVPKLVPMVAPGRPFLVNLIFQWLSFPSPSTVRPDNALKVRFSVTLGEDSEAQEVEVALV
jgi:hypothetical protein